MTRVKYFEALLYLARHQIYQLRRSNDIQVSAKRWIEQVLSCYTPHNELGRVYCF